MGAYLVCFEMMEKIGLDPGDFFQRKPFSVTIIGDKLLNLESRGTRAPWHLILGGMFASGLSFSEKRSFLPFLRHFSPPKEDISAEEWLLSLGQTPQLIDRLWAPICLAALTTPIERASALLLHNVLEMTFFKAAPYSDWCFPTKTLDEIFPDPAALWLQSKGAQVHLRKRVTDLIIEDDRCTGIVVGGEKILSDAVVLATGPRATSAMLSKQPALSCISKQIEALGAEPISTLYLQYPEHVTLGQPMLGFSDPFIQWVFDRGISHNTPGLLAVITSGHADLINMPSQVFTQMLTAQLGDMCPFLRSYQPKSKWIRDRQGAISAHVGCQEIRPHNRTLVEGFWLCGDYCITPYPSTLEGAMLSGKQCAEQIDKMFQKEKTVVLSES